MFHRNTNPAGFFGKIVLGLAEILDGLVAVLSLGFFASSFAWTLVHRQMTKHFTKQIEARRHGDDNQSF